MTTLMPKISWNQLLVLAHVTDQTALPRSPETYQGYQQWKSLIKKRLKVCPSNYLYNCYLNFKSTTLRHLATVNNFPYNLNDNIHHFVIWSDQRKFKNDKIPSWHYDYLTEQMQKIVGAKHAFWIENPENLKSVKTIPHVHVFVYKPKQIEKIQKLQYYK